MERKGGDVLGDWILREVAGPGPASELWRAVHRDDPTRAAAIRFFVAPVRVKAELLRSLEHPNIARVQEVDAAAAEPFLRREWVEGAPLYPRALSSREAAEVAGRVLQALAHAHAKGISHGRLTSMNVLLGAGGRVTVTDFALSGGPADPAGDLRALAELLAESGLAGSPWLQRLQAGGFASADEARAALPARAPLPSWIAGPVLIVGVFFIAYVAVGVTFAGLQGSLRLLAAAAGVGLCAAVWKHLERPLAAAVFWGALFWGYGARLQSGYAVAGAAVVALAAGAAWRAGRRPSSPTSP